MAVKTVYWTSQPEVFQIPFIWNAFRLLEDTGGELQHPLSILIQEMRISVLEGLPTPTLATTLCSSICSGHKMVPGILMLQIYHP